MSESGLSNEKCDGMDSGQSKPTSQQSQEGTEPQPDCGLWTGGAAWETTQGRKKGAAVVMRKKDLLGHRSPLRSQSSSSIPYQKRQRLVLNHTVT